MITREQYADYIAAFNRNDFAGFTKFYAEDVVLELPVATLRGRQAIFDFYAKVKATVRETLTIGQLVIDENGLAVEAETEFLALADAPDFIVRPLKKGEAIHSTSFILYEHRDGQFTRIRSARFKME
ncbi:MAG TPA: nuclear transport factor 2 family protein [Stellaceae bacterium]|nr:nuclear transport factor 2 family protein [Stellaceae bacterium]